MVQIADVHAQQTRSRHWRCGHEGPTPCRSATGCASQLRMQKLMDHKVARWLEAGVRDAIPSAQPRAATRAAEDRRPDPEVAHRRRVAWSKSRIRSTPLPARVTRKLTAMTIDGICRLWSMLDPIAQVTVTCRSDAAADVRIVTIQAGVCVSAQTRWPATHRMPLSLRDLVPARPFGRSR